MKLGLRKQRTVKFKYFHSSSIVRSARSHCYCMAEIWFMIELHYCVCLLITNLNISMLSTFFSSFPFWREHCRENAILSSKLKKAENEWVSFRKFDVILLCALSMKSFLCPCHWKHIELWPWAVQCQPENERTHAIAKFTSNVCTEREKESPF